MLPSRPEPAISRQRLVAGLACYVVLALIAFYSLEGDFRLAVWILLAGLAFRTVLAGLRKN